MAAGADVIYQATFFDGTLRGHADFLLRVDDPGAPVASGGRTTTRSRTRSSRATSRRARSSRSARTSTSSSGSRASGPSGCTSRSAAAPAPSSACASTTTWPTTGAPATASWRRWPTRRRRATRRPTTYPEPVEHCDVCRWAAECVDPSPRRRPPEPRRRDHRPAAAGADRAAASRRSRRSATCALPIEPPLTEGIGAGALDARPRAGPDPARGPARGTHRYELLLPGAGRSRSSPSAAWPRSRRPRRATCSSTSRATRTRFDDGLDYLFGAPRHRRHASTRSGRATTRDEFTLDGERRAFERLIDLDHGSARRRPDDARLPLRAVRADRAQAADGPLRDARGRGRPAAPRGRPRRPAARRPPVAPGLGRELLDQEDGGVLRLRPRDRPARRRVEHRRLRAVARARRGRAAGRRTTSSGSSATTATTSSATSGCATGWRAGATELARQTGLRRAAPDRPRRAAPARPDREPGPGPGARRPAGRTGCRADRPGRADADQQARPGCSPSCSAGIGARTSRCGGSSIG